MCSETNIVSVFMEKSVGATPRKRPHGGYEVYDSYFQQMLTSTHSLPHGVQKMGGNWDYSPLLPDSPGSWKTSNYTTTRHANPYAEKFPTGRRRGGTEKERLDGVIKVSFGISTHRRQI